MSTTEVIIKYILMPPVMMLVAFTLLLLYLRWKDRKVIAARGGIQNIFSDFFAAIEQMPYSQIVYSNVDEATAKYVNPEGKSCKFEIFMTKEITRVKFFIYFEGKWVKSRERSFDQVFTGESFLYMVRLCFPESGLVDI